MPLWIGWTAGYALAVWGIDATYSLTEPWLKHANRRVQNVAAGVRFLIPLVLAFLISFRLRAWWWALSPFVALIVTMLEWISTMPGVPSRAQESTAGLYCWGGKVNDLAPDANAFVHRNADFLFKCEVLWEPEDDPDLIVANLDWLEGYHTAMQPYLSGGAYQNFTDPSQADWPRAYYGENLERLVEVKRAWDPDNLFHFAQSIPTAL